MVTLYTTHEVEGDDGEIVEKEYEIDCTVTLPTRARGWDPGDTGEVEVVEVREGGMRLKPWPRWCDVYAREYAVDEAMDCLHDSRDDAAEARAEARRQGD